MENLEILIMSGLVCCLPFFAQVFFPKPSEIETEKIAGKRYSFFDIAKGLAIIAVVVIHAIYFFLTYETIHHILTLNFINNLSRFAIPFFLISSGALLTLKDFSWTTIKSFYSRKLFRIFLPYVITVLVIGIYKHLSFGTLFEQGISGSILTPYYFIIVLLQLYILYPFLQIFRKSRLALIIIFLITLISFLIPELWYLGPIPLCGQYLFFFFYGISMRDYFLSPSTSRNNVFAWGILLVLYFIVVILIGGYYYNVQLVYGPALFMILFTYRDKLFTSKINHFLESVGKHSLWIFLVHFPIEYALYFYFKALHLEYFLLLFVTIVVTFFVSYFFACSITILKKCLLRI